MKKWIGFLSVSLLAFGLAACDRQQQEAPAMPPAEQGSTMTPSSPEAQPNQMEAPAPSIEQPQPGENPSINGIAPGEPYPADRMMPPEVTPEGQPNDGTTDMMETPSEDQNMINQTTPTTPETAPSTGQ